ncbi:conserved exported hypothetical protein [Roseovarius sp. EC-HK134]|uniref:DUF302 domain-containing protein n=1 Tax=unclassified Roseovarius TaxID=2614913 RepID=UPI0012547C04|nr:MULTISPECIES: DUF302 domain-containing protein [unclassified Roseovarius]VVT10822.1 conserved exported hypothetical protein [Roseovarius sp. EC-HK134]VVT11013.1 conserved exported hypothetical protein [Roseovarius sp. EC-SD190]
MKRTVLAGALALISLPAAASEQATTYPFDGSFDDATFAVESAIVGRGLVIDLQSHVGDMLNRTGADVGSDVKIFDAADIFLFCSATLSREVMEANPMNIAHCPYGIFVADQGGEVLIGYRNFPEGEMQKVQAMLDDIVQEALQ